MLPNDLLIFPLRREKLPKALLKALSCSDVLVCSAFSIVLVTTIFWDICWIFESLEKVFQCFKCLWPGMRSDWSLLLTKRLFAIHIFCYVAYTSPSDPIVNHSSSCFVCTLPWREKQQCLSKHNISTSRPQRPPNLLFSSIFFLMRIQLGLCLLLD